MHCYGVSVVNFEQVNANWVNCCNKPFPQQEIKRQDLICFEQKK